MPSPPKSIGSFRAFTRFLLAAVYFLVARVMAERGARGFVSEDWAPLVEQAMFAFLLIVGYAGFGFALDRQIAGHLGSVGKQGLSRRTGWLGEIGLGVAFGWAIAVACVLPLVVFGGIALHFTFSAGAFVWLLADAAFFAFATLAVQVAFRGYPLQSATRAIGELPAVLVLSVLYGIMQAWLPGASRASLCVQVVLGLLLSLAYVRTRALWLPWGLHFSWIASRALLFGLPIHGVTSHSPVVQGDALASYALSGGGFGLDGSWTAFVVLLVAMPFLYRATRDLSFIYNAPVLEPAGLEVDLDAAAKRQHEAATRPEQPEIKPLVQILPVISAHPLPPASELDGPRD